MNCVPPDLRLLALLARPEHVWVGILNVTPDSFSDGGAYQTHAELLLQAEQLVMAGAEILDVGGASTRPGSEPPSAAEECARVLPALAALRAYFQKKDRPLFLSLDTYRPEVAEAAATAGNIDLINDILAGRMRFRNQAGVVQTTFSVAAKYHLGIILMHSLGMPLHMQKNAIYQGSVVHHVTSFLRTQALAASGAGVRALILDPGIGFGKSVDHNLTLLSEQAFRSYRSIGLPVMIGLSRKGFLAKLPDAAPELALDPRARDVASKHWEGLALQRGARLIRSHKMPSEMTGSLPERNA